MIDFVEYESCFFGDGTNDILRVVDTTFVKGADSFRSGTDE